MFKALNIYWWAFTFYTLYSTWFQARMPQGIWFLSGALNREKSVWLENECSTPSYQPVIQMSSVVNFYLLKSGKISSIQIIDRQKHPATDWETGHRKRILDQIVGIHLQFQTYTRGTTWPCTCGLVTLWKNEPAPWTCANNRIVLTCNWKMKKW